MKNVNVKLVLFYLVFMLGLKANAQNSDKESIDIGAKIQFIQKNDPKGYDKLIEELNRNSYVYGRASDSLKALAKKIVCEKTGDCGLVDSWELMAPDTSKHGNVPDSLKQTKSKIITTELFTEVNMLLEESKQKIILRMRNSESLINKKFAEVLEKEGALNISNKPKDGKKRLFGKEKTR